MAIMTGFVHFNEAKGKHDWKENQKHILYYKHLV